MKAYEYIVKIKDYASDKMKMIGKAAGFTDGQLDKMIASANESGSATQKASLGAKAYSNSLGFLKTAALGVMTALVGVGALNIFTNIAKLGAESEQTKIKFQVLTQSVERGNKLFSELNEFANVTPFSNRDLQKNATTLLSFGISADKVKGTLSSLGDVAGGDAEKLGSLTLAYSQAQSAGKLMGQDLLQMINAGFNPLQEISRTTGESMASLKEKMSQGGISAEMLTQAFNSATSEGGMFYGMMDRMSGTLGGKWSTLVGTLQSHLANLGEKLAPLLIQFVDFGIKIIEYLPPTIAFFETLPGIIQENLDVIMLLGGAVGALSINFLASTIAAKAQAFWSGILTAKTWLLNTAMYANPAGLVVAGIMALIAVFIIAYRKIDWFRGAVLGAWEVLKGFGIMIYDFVITRIHELISGITGIGSALVKFFKGDFKGAVEEGKKSINQLTGVDSKKQLFEDAKGLGQKFSDGYKEGVSQIADNKLKDKKFNFFGNGQNSELINQPIDDLTTGFGDGADSAKNKTKGLEGVTGGGSKQTNITINLGKLQESTIINATTVNEGVQDMQEMIQQALLRLLNSTNQMQTN